MIIEAGQVWKKLGDRVVIVIVEKVGKDKVKIRVGSTVKHIDLDMFKNAVVNYGYLLCTDLTKALL